MDKRITLTFKSEEGERVFDGWLEDWIVAIFSVLSLPQQELVREELTRRAQRWLKR